MLTALRLMDPHLHKGNPGCREERQEWEAWLERMNRAGADGVPFDEPPPSQRQSTPKSNGDTA